MNGNGRYSSTTAKKMMFPPPPFFNFKRNEVGFQSHGMSEGFWANIIRILKKIWAMNPSNHKPIVGLCWWLSLFVGIFLLLRLLHLGGVPIEKTQAPTWTHWPRPSAEKSGWTGYRVTFLVRLVLKHISGIWGMEWNMLCQVKPPLVFIGLDFYDFHHFLLRKVCDHPNGVSRFFFPMAPRLCEGRSDCQHGFI